MVLLHGPQPILIDSGFGSDLETTEALLRAAGVAPGDLSLLANTHYHCDHSGGNSGLQRRYGIPIAAHRWEAAQINRRDPEACSVEWLDQPLEEYYVNLILDEGMQLSSGRIDLQVLHIPGHTLGHCAFYVKSERLLICGDAVHADDVAWINSFREGAGALDRILESLNRLAALNPRRAYSGHGPAIDNPLAAIDAARRRYDKWIEDPHRLGWHACKRIFAYALMIHRGLDEELVGPYLLSCGWFQDFSRHIFGLTPEQFIAPLLAEMERSGAAAWSEGRLIALADHSPPPSDWPPANARPRHWSLT